MSETRRDLLGAGFSLVLIALAAFVMQRFFLPLIWAGILCVATWPLYPRLRRLMGERAILAALALTLLCAGVFITPLLLGMAQAARQAPELANFIVTANNEGIAAVPYSAVDPSLENPCVGGSIPPRHQFCIYLLVTNLGNRQVSIGSTKAPQMY